MNKKQVSKPKLFKFKFDFKRQKTENYQFLQLRNKIDEVFQFFYTLQRS